MIAEEVIDNHPLRLLDQETGLPEADLSVVLARPGVGKSAVLINFALDTLVQGKKVLHICSGMDSEKVHEYYQEIHNELTEQSAEFAKLSWADINNNLLVISYTSAESMVADLDNELTTLEDSVHLEPSLLVLDGFDVDGMKEQHLKLLKDIAQKHRYKTLASFTIHRNEDGSVNLDQPIELVKNYSQHVYFLEPSQDKIKMDFLTENGMLQLPIFFCPNDLTFKKNT